MPAGEQLGTPTLYFNPCAFSLPTAGFLGTAGRDILRGPGFENLDFSLAKDIPVKKLGESGKLEFRAETFNILNRANFEIPNRTVFSGTSGLVVSTVGQIATVGNNAPRQIQFALRLQF